VSSIPELRSKIIERIQDNKSVLVTNSEVLELLKYTEDLESVLKQKIRKTSKDCRFAIMGAIFRNLPNAILGSIWEIKRVPLPKLINSTDFGVVESLSLVIQDNNGKEVGVFSGGYSGDEEEDFKILVNELITTIVTNNTMMLVKPEFRI